MSQPPRKSSTRIQSDKPPPPGGHDPEPAPAVIPLHPAARAVLTVWALAFAVLVLYELVGFVVKLAF